MKKILTPVANGGAPWSNDTLQGILNAEVWTALEALLQNISLPSATGNVGVIVSGCNVTLNGAGPNYNCSSGYVYLAGQFMYFPGFSNLALPQYIIPNALINTQKTFLDGVARNFITQQDAGVTATVPGSGQYISLTTTGNLGGIGGYRIENYVSVGVNAAINTAVNPTAWTAVTSFFSGWSQATGYSGYHQLQYRKVNDLVYVKGVIGYTGSPPNTQDMFTLPLGFRPNTALASNIVVPVVAQSIGGEVRYIRILSSGVVTLLFLAALPSNGVIIFQEFCFSTNGLLNP